MWLKRLPVHYLPVVEMNRASIIDDSKRIFSTCRKIKILICNRIYYSIDVLSGLDSLASYQVIKLLKSFASVGKNVICTVHQPSAKLFEMFDNVSNYILNIIKCFKIWQ